jgi:hypothetical protein
VTSFLISKALLLFLWYIVPFVTLAFIHKSARKTLLVHHLTSELLEYSLFFSFSLIHLRDLLDHWVNNFLFFPNSHLFMYSSSKIYSFLTSHDCECLSCSCRCRNHLSIFCFGSLVIMNCSICTYLERSLFLLWF